VKDCWFGEEVWISRRCIPFVLLKLTKGGEGDEEGTGCEFGCEKKKCTFRTEKCLFKCELVSK